MRYEYYKTASERHLETCRKLKEIVISTYLGKTLDSTGIKKQNDLLANIYYLSGYAIECILSYSIVTYIIKVDVDFRKKIAKRTGGKIEDVSIRELKVGDNKCNVGYAYGKYVLYRPGHRFQSNMFFFNDGSKISGIDSIRGINGKAIPQKNVKDLFLKWNAEVRYSENDFISYLTTDDIFDFLDFTEEVYDGITTIILPTYA